ncbi:MAG: Do family serine endopeptidase [Planctomycetes bacterium]|nr:Do family serine endopeptidase [Planctomycetota bacterium]
MTITSKALYAATTLAAIALTALCGGTAADGEHPTATGRATGEPFGPAAFTHVATTVDPAVVFVRTDTKVKQPGHLQLPDGNWAQPFGDDLFRQFFGQRLDPRAALPEQHVVGQGSGFIISDDGYILTNNHVVGDADAVTVRLQDGREFTATTVGKDQHSDVAVIKVDATGLPALKFGNSDKLEIGEWVMAVGSPFGLSSSVTAGIVSAKGRNAVGLTDYDDFIQTDAAINPGNSGGPLVNLDGEVVGMNTAIFSRSGGYMGIGFAIPANMAKAISRQLIDHGAVTRGYLGVLIQDIDAALGKSFGVAANKGILVAQVNADTPAAAAGLERGDVIVELDGKSAEKVAEFRNRIALMAPGSVQHLALLRDGKRLELSVTLGKLGDDVAAEAPQAAAGSLGISVQELDASLAQQFDCVGMTGVLVTEVRAGSIAQLGGLERGMLIQEVDRHPVGTVADYRREIDQAAQRDSVLLLVRDGAQAHYLVLRLPH